jgi:hypothetical protein
MALGTMVSPKSGSTDPGCKWGGSPAFLSPLTGGPIKLEGVNIAGTRSHRGRKAIRSG